MGKFYQKNHVGMPLTFCCMLIFKNVCSIGLSRNSGLARASYDMPSDFLWTLHPIMSLKTCGKFKF